MRYWYKVIIFFKKIIFRNQNRFTLENDITNCTFDDIRAQLKGMKFKIYNSTSEGYLALFSDDYTEYVLSFTPGGKVIAIELEHWKDMNIKFVKRGTEQI